MHSIDHHTIPSIELVDMKNPTGHAISVQEMTKPREHKARNSSSQVSISRGPGNAYRHGEAGSKTDDTVLSDSEPGTGGKLDNFPQDFHLAMIVVALMLGLFSMGLDLVCARSSWLCYMQIF